MMDSPSRPYKQAFAFSVNRSSTIVTEGFCRTLVSHLPKAKINWSHVTAARSLYIVDFFITIETYTETDMKIAEYFIKHYTGRYDDAES